MLYKHEEALGCLLPSNLNVDELLKNGKQQLWFMWHKFRHKRSHWKISDGRAQVNVRTAEVSCRFSGFMVVQQPETEYDDFSTFCIEYVDQIMYFNSYSSRSTCLYTYACQYNQHVV